MRISALLAAVVAGIAAKNVRDRSFYRPVERDGGEAPSIPECADALSYSWIEPNLDVILKGDSGVLGGSVLQRVDISKG